MPLFVIRRDIHTKEYNWVLQVIDLLGLKMDYSVDRYSFNQ